jgi:lipoprotein-releasing system permease protein
MLKLFLWLRYLRKIRIVLLSISAIALSVTLLIIVSSLFTGFIKAFKQAAVDAMGDVVIAAPVKFPKYNQLIKRLEQTDVVEAATAMISGYGLLHLDRGNVRVVEIWGIDPNSRARVAGFDRFLLSKKSEQDLKLKTQNSKLQPSVWKTGSGFIGIGLLCKTDEKTDEYDYQTAVDMLNKEVKLTTGSISNQKVGVNRKVVTFSIADVVETGVYQFDSGCVYLPIEQVGKIMYPDQNLPVAEQIQIKLKANVDPEVALIEIHSLWLGFVEQELDTDVNLLKNATIDTAIHLQRNVIDLYRQQMNVLLVIFGVVSFGAVLLVFCILYMIVRIKQKDIAILKSCGTSGASIALIFVGFGAFVGTIGSVVGICLGYIITRNLNVIEHWIRLIFGLKLWRESVYFFSRIPNEVSWSWAVYIAAFGILAAAIGALIPAVVAAVTKPVEILRYE